MAHGQLIELTQTATEAYIVIRWSIAKRAMERDAPICELIEWNEATRVYY